MSKYNEKKLETLTTKESYEYVVTLNENTLREQLQEARNAIREFVSQFDRPELLCPTLVDYLNKIESDRFKKVG